MAAHAVHASSPAAARGYALLEVIITLVISLLALSALVKFQGELFRGDALARARSQAVLLAEQRVETLYGAIPAAGPEAAGDGADAWSAELEPVAGETPAMYARAWSVSGDGDTGTARIEVRVSWKDHAGAVQEVGVTTHVDPVAISYGAAGWAGAEFITLE